MQAISQNPQDLNQIIQSLNSKDYQDISKVFMVSERTLSSLTKKQNSELAIYIKEMDAKVVDQLKENPKFLNAIQKAIQSAGPLLCSNITLKATEEAQEICSHKVLLSAQSTYFRALFEGNFLERNLKTITLSEREIPENILKEMITYANTGNIDLSQDLGELLYYAESFLFTDLKKTIENHLISAIFNDAIKEKSLVNLWDVAEKANAERLLTAILFKKSHILALDTRIHLYCVTKGFQGDLKELKLLIWSFFPQFDSHLLTINVSSVKAFSALSSVLSMDKLYIDLSKTSTADLHLIAQVPQKIEQYQLELDLRDCVFSDEVATFLAKIIQTQGNLVMLNLNHAKIKDQSLTILFDALQQNNTLQELNLHYCLIGDKEAHALAVALQKNTSLRKLNLAYNQIRHLGVTGLAKFLLDKSLQELDLSGNSIGDEGTQAFANTLQQNTHLEKIYLGYNDLSDLNIETIANALYQNKTLKELDLKNNQFDDKGTKALANLLKLNSSLQKLNLQNNKLTDEGAEAIAQSLQENNTLKDLNLQANLIADQGAEALAKALEVNDTLESLNLQNNRIREKSVKVIAHSIKKNKTLKALNLSFNLLGRSAKPTLKKGLISSHPHLKISLSYYN